ncbi:MAG: GNAT family N-acetyltransferase [Alphaproteobacteria bacterium]|nr:GNAT family N-acetyltransferase [Alphaproteobacteria bacterium]
MTITYPGQRIHLRPIRVDDVDAIMTWVNDPEVVRNFATMGNITREQEVAFLERMIASETDRLYAIETLEGQYLGNAGIHKIWWPARNGRLGIVIGDKAHHGRGLAQEALRLLLAHGFGELGLHKLWMVHYATNGRMHHIAGKLGMREEGRLRDEYFHQGAFHDMVRHAILEEEYRELATSWGHVHDGDQARS